MAFKVIILSDFISVMFSLQENLFVFLVVAKLFYKQYLFVCICVIFTLHLLSLHILSFLQNIYHYLIPIFATTFTTQKLKLLIITKTPPLLVGFGPAKNNITCFNRKINK